MNTHNDKTRMTAAWILAALPLVACNTAELRDPGHSEWRQMCEAQITGTAPCQDGTGMWRITERDETHRWIVVRNGDDLCMERARRRGYREHDYWISVPDESAPDEGRWKLVQPHGHAGDSLEVSFDPTFRGVQAVWNYDLKRGQASYQPSVQQYGGGGMSKEGAVALGISVVVDIFTPDTEVVRGHGILAAWPGLDGQMAGMERAVADAGARPEMGR